MKIHTKTLPSGLRIQGIALEGSCSVTTLVLAKAGSRHETKAKSGIAHFLEHMFFKGAQKYQTPKSVSSAIDSIGGSFNAFTGKEYAGYYVKCGIDFLDRSLDVLSDMILQATLPPEEIEKERGVILEEIAMYQDMPPYQVAWESEKAILGDQPLGRDQIGTKENVLKFDRSDLETFKNDYYRPNNMVITLAGAIEPAMLDWVAAYFQMPKSPASKPWTDFDTTTKVSREVFIPKETEQYHIALGARALSQDDQDYPTLQILKVILGGNMSSRMFQHLREEKGLCYSIRTSIDSFTDTGLITTQAGVKLDRLEEAVSGIHHEYDILATKGVTHEEVSCAQNYLLGRLDLALEDPEYVAHDFADELLLYDRVNDYGDWRAKLKKVTKTQVQDLASRLLKKEDRSLTVMGPTDSPL